MTKTNENAAAAGSNQRELETAPLLLQKASQLLIVGALFPFYTGVQYASQAISQVGNGYRGAVTQNFDWKTWALAKVLILLGGWIAIECAKVRSGKDKSPLAGLAKAHELAGSLVALVLFLVAGGLVFQSSGVLVEIQNHSAKEVFKLGAIAEIGVLALGMYTLAHIISYIGGGKFNPIFPLMFLGPAVAGLLNLVAGISVFSNPHTGIGALGLIGSLIVGAAGCYAMFIMWKSIQEAQEHGKRRQEEIRAARKAEREAARLRREAGE